MNEMNTTTAIEEEARFLQNQVRWVLPEIKNVLKMNEMLADESQKAEFLEDSMKAVYKRLFKALEASGTDNKPSAFNG